MSSHQPIHPSREQIESLVKDIRVMMLEAGSLHFAQTATMPERVVLALADQLAYVRGMMAGQEIELRSREENERVWRFKVESRDLAIQELQEGLAALKKGVEVSPPDIDAAWNEYATRYRDMLSDDPDSDLEIFSAGFRAGATRSTLPPQPATEATVLPDFSDGETIRKAVEWGVQIGKGLLHIPTNAKEVPHA